MSALERLRYVLPPSVETCTKNESKPGSVSYFVSNVRVGLPVGTATDFTIAASLLSASGAASAESVPWSGAAVVTVHSTGSGSALWRRRT